MDLSTIIVNYRTRDLLRDCLTSLYDQTPDLEHEVFVVDNASGDGSVEMVEAEFPDVRLIASDENLGFARANNLALKQAAGDVIALLNPDTVVVERAMEKIVAYLRENPRVGAVCPDLPQPDGTLQVTSCGYLPGFWRMFCQYFFLTRLFPRSRLFRGMNLVAGVYRDPVRVEWLSGACLAARREVWNEVGPLDESWFMFAEDMEWCQRALRRRYQLHYLPQVTVYHIWGASSKGDAHAVSTMWLDSIASWHRRDHGRISTAAMMLVISAGLRLRSLLHKIRSMRGCGDKWRVESEYVGRCSRKAAMLAWAGLKGDIP
ncbi:MAG: glycosyltransferase family 2 protein [Armatimonadetes bacterium]|nr:glycosyltransferase family 2 protein [Armatimonadota bacterium]